MNVIRADVMGMCFGVRDALTVIGTIESPREVTIHGQLVHNEEVLSGLGRQGFAMSRESERDGMPSTPAVLITAHGVSDRERARLAAAGKRLIDTTCPLVTRVHHAAQRLQDRGYFVLVIGRRGHVEVQGIVEDLSRFEIIETPEEVREYEADRLGLVCQTTTPAHLAERIHAAVVATNPLAEVCFIDTVCHPTKDHQRALERLIEKADAVVVVGGRNSNNTLALAELCRSRGKAVLHVSSATDIDAGWFRGFETVGLTAGTSTLDSTIEEVHEALLCLPTEVGVG